MTSANTHRSAYSMDRAGTIPVIVPPPTTQPQFGTRLSMPQSGIVSTDMPNTAVYAQQIVEDLRSCGAAQWTVGSTRGFIRLETDTALSDGAYRIIYLDDSGVTIAGSTPEGIRNGVQTFRQVLVQTWPRIPQMNIVDAPQFRVRGYLLDVTRGRVPTMAWLKHWVDVLCYYKYNQFQLYMEHAFAYPHLPAVWKNADPITPDELAQLDAYCAERAITLVPAVASFGHQYVALRTPSLRNLGELPQDADKSFSFVERQQHHTFNAADPQAFAVACSMVDSVCSSVQGTLCNIGADETFDLGRGQSHAVATRIGTDALYAQWVSAMAEHVHEQGGNVQMWADIAVTMPQILRKLPANITMLNWDYSPHPQEQHIRAVAQANFKQIVCPAVHAWNALIPRIACAWSNIARMAQLGMTYRAEGMLVTDWGDFGHINDPRMALPGLLFGACCAWNPHVQHEDVIQAISRVAYGDTQNAVINGMQQVSACDMWRWDDMVRYIELDDGTGHVNADVWRSIQELYNDARSPVDLRHARTMLLQHYVTRKAVVTPNGLHTAADQLLRALHDVHPRAGSGAARVDTNDICVPIALGVEGTLLLNDIGDLLASTYGLTTTHVAASEIAVRWNHWCAQYTAAWHTVSRNSELPRLTHIFDVIEQFLTEGVLI